MKNIALVLNGILLVAVGVLYYLHFSGQKNGTTSTVSAPADLKIAYIKSDSVLKYYDYFKEMKTILEAKGKKLDQDLQNRGQSLQNEITSYQRNMSNLTIGQAKALEEDLGKKQQNFRLYQQSLEQELVNDQSKLTEALYGRITKFLTKYSAGSGLQVVFKFDQTSDVLFGGPGIDISQDVIKGLNEDFKIEKLNPPAKTDSTAAKRK
ncbi:MAG TPA: OmpH family outer membrane protein [Cyclobacteriaceae bacterium]|nr:OmpH family outer membrane protein [Cyclobacteriaceae bacterium]